MTTDTAATSPYYDALAAHDPAGLSAACTADVVFNSPITTSIRFEGADELRYLFANVLEVYDEFHCVEETGSGDTRVVHMHARIGPQELDEVQLLRLDGTGKVREITMFIRPLPGVTALAAGLGPRLARRHGRWRGLLAALATRPLALMTRAGDKPVTRLVGS
ncbi:MAG: nuclear transport factor 2 family protein [Thermoleophilaceae bacterium]